MTNESKIGSNGVDTRGNCRSTTVNESRKGGRNIMARSMSVRSGSRARQHAKTIRLLLVFAAAIVIVSGIALAPIGKEKASLPAKTLIPGTPYNIIGFTYDSVGVKLPSCTVNITHLATGNYKVVVSDATFAAYLVDLTSFAPTWQYGDEVKITAEKDLWTGENQSVVAGGKLWLNATLNVLIPEFPMVIVPVTGMVALVVVVSLRRRGEEQ